MLIVSSYNSRGKKKYKEVFGGIKLCCFDNFRHTVTFSAFYIVVDLSLQWHCHRLTILELGI